MAGCYALLLPAFSWSGAAEANACAGWCTGDDENCFAPLKREQCRACERCVDIVKAASLTSERSKASELETKCARASGNPNDAFRGGCEWWCTAADTEHDCLLCRCQECDFCVGLLKTDDGSKRGQEGFRGVIEGSTAYEAAFVASPVRPDEDLKADDFQSITHAGLHSTILASNRMSNHEAHGAYDSGEGSPSNRNFSSSGDALVYSAFNARSQRHPGNKHEAKEGLLKTDSETVMQASASAMSRSALTMEAVGSHAIGGQQHAHHIGFDASPVSHTLGISVSAHHSSSGQPVGHRATTS
ncbi:MAG: hypothetical protein SGPRY_008746 [Prymnesium sp.]